MKTGQYPVLFLAAVLLVLALGIELSLAQSFSIRWGGAALAALLLASLLLLWRGNRLCAIMVLLLFFTLGIVRLQAALFLPPADISYFAGAGAEVKVSGTIDDEPRWTQAVLPDGSRIYKVRYLVAVEQVRRPGGDWQKAAGKCYLYARAPVMPDKVARIGDAVTASGRVRLPRGYQNPGQLDTALLLRSDGITASVVAGKGGAKTEAREGHAFRRFIAGIREHYRTGMERAMPKEDAAAVFAMLFGGYQGLSEDLVADFQATGIVHILSVSGSHISLIAAVMAWLAAALRLPRAVSAALVLSCIALYSILAGCVPPVIRSGIMGGLAFLALALGRERESRCVLLLTGIFMLLWNPLLLFHISFELSYLATAGLLFLAPVFRAWLRARGMPDVLAMGTSRFQRSSRRFLCSPGTSGRCRFRHCSPICSSCPSWSSSSSSGSLRGSWPSCCRFSAMSSSLRRVCCWDWRRSSHTYSRVSQAASSTSRRWAGLLSCSTTSRWALCC